MAKYGVIIAALFTSLVMASSCQYNPGSASLVCAPSAAVADSQEGRESTEDFNSGKAEQKTKREPLILLRILTEL